VYNLRYHIVSLVAVFLSLTIGLLLGTIVAERGTLDAQRSALVSSLERDFADLSERNATLQTENEARVDFLGVILPDLIGGRLADKTVLLLVNTGRTDGLGSTQEAIVAAGGVPVTLTIERQGLGLDDPEIQLALGREPSADLETWKRSVETSLALEWSAAGERPLTESLIELGVLDHDGFEPETAVNAVGVLASWDAEPAERVLDIAERMNEAGTLAIGIEALGRNTGVAVAAVDHGLSAVDHMRLPEGTYSLVMLLAGEAEGYFGTGDTAVSRYPRTSREE
jgi:hypothetical protein